MFLKVDDREKYNGAVPSGAYLAQVYKKEVEDIRPHLDREMKKASVNQFSIDASSKAPKKLTQHNATQMSRCEEMHYSELLVVHPTRAAS
jgi:hypothetical protein